MNDTSHKPLVMLILVLFIAIIVGGVYWSMNKTAPVGPRDITPEDVRIGLSSLATTTDSKLLRMPESKQETLLNTLKPKTATTTTAKPTKINQQNLEKLLK